MKMGRSEENRRNGSSCRKVEWTDYENMTTRVNEHTFRVKLVSMSEFLKLCKKTGEEKGGWEYRLGSEFKQEKEGSKVMRGVWDNETYSSYFLLSTMIFFRLYVIFSTSDSPSLAYLTLLEDAVSFWNLSSDSQNYQVFLWTTHQ